MLTDTHTDGHTDGHTDTRTLLLIESLPLSWARLKTTLFIFIGVMVVIQGGALLSA